jgi:hypothetical protein
MPVFLLPDDLPVFPDPRQAEPDGLLALGGGLEPARLLLAYSARHLPVERSEDEPLHVVLPGAADGAAPAGRPARRPRTLRKHLQSPGRCA